MEKIQIEITGLSYSQTKSGAYALVLSEVNGGRRLPIIIGGFEAQAIAIAMEKMQPVRPLTHDLLKNVVHAFEIEVTEIVIYKLEQGVFYSKLICKQGATNIEVDARTSDAVALSVRFKCPIYTYETILGSAGLQLDDTDAMDDSFAVSNKNVSASKKESQNKPVKSLEQLEKELKQAIENEEYEVASRIRDEINKRTS